MATETNPARFDLVTFADTGMWGAKLTGADSGHDDDGSMWTMQTWLITAPTGETMGTFAADAAAASRRLRAIAY